MPDFSRLFFRRRRAKLCVTSSSGGNYRHEVVFLSSYLHDATFRTRDLIVRSDVLRLPLDRDCWEYGLTQPDGSLYLYSCPSELTIRGVRRLQWSRKRLPAEVQITSVYCGERYFREPRSGHLVFYSADTGIRLGVFGPEEFLRFELRDLEQAR